MSSLERARHLIEVGRLDAALDELATAARDDPDEPLVHVLRAACLVDLDRATEALDAAHRALEMDGELATAHHLRSVALGELGDHAGMLDAARRAIHLDAETPSIWVQFIRALLSSQRFDEAEHTLGQMRQRFPNHVNTEVAAAIVALHRPNPVTTALEKLSSKGGFALLLLVSFLIGGIVVYGLAWTAAFAVRRGAALRAEGSVRRALELEPDSYRLRMLLADLLDDQGRVVGAFKLRVRTGVVEPRPELVDKVVHTSRRMLVAMTAAATAATVAAVASTAASVESGSLPTWLAAGIAAAATFAAVAAARLGIERWYRELPAGLVDRIRRPLLPFARAGRILGLIAGVPWVVAGRSLRPDDAPVGPWTVVWWAVLVAVVSLTAEWAVSARWRRSGPPSWTRSLPAAATPDPGAEPDPS